MDGTLVKASCGRFQVFTILARKLPRLFSILPVFWVNRSEETLKLGRQVNLNRRLFFAEGFKVGKG